jgi:zinc carboxypeptidase
MSGMHAKLPARSLRPVVAAALALASVLTVTAQRPGDISITPQELGRLWDAEHVSPALPPLVDHPEVVRRLDALVAAAPDLFTMEKIGESIEGRSINYVGAGSGPTGVLLWSQMHGDEPTATSALFDLFDYLARHRQDAVVRRVLSQLTLHVVPMLNPDGADRFQRRNAQSIDVNRDALRLQTPEGQILKALRDRLKPAVGFNLHNQSWRTSVGEPPRPASISLLSVAFDEKRTVTPARTLTKKLCAVIRDSLEPFASGQIGRYDDEFEVRAFGDNITLWGTPVVLIETGPWPSAEPDAPLVRLNFVAIVSALDALASGRVNEADPKRYESLPVNESRMFYVLVKNATVINGAGVPPYTADIGIVANRRVRTTNGTREIQIGTNIDDMGDLHTSGALRTIDAAGVMAVPDRGYAEGAFVSLPDWKEKGDATIAVGQPARIALLRPDADGKYRVEIVLK